METAQLIIGYISMVVSIVMYIPQSFKVWKTKDTSALSKPTFIVLYFGCIFWIIWSVMKHLITIWLTNVGIALLMIPIIYYLFIDKKIYSIIMSFIIISTVIFAITYSIVLPKDIYINASGVEVDRNEMNSILSTTLSIIASFGTSFCWLPQVIHVLKTKDTSSLSLITLSLLIFNQALLTVFYGTRVGSGSTDISIMVSFTACIVPLIFILIIFVAKIFIKQPQQQPQTA